MLNKEMLAISGGAPMATVTIVFSDREDVADYVDVNAIITYPDDGNRKETVHVYGGLQIQRKIPIGHRISIDEVDDRYYWLIIDKEASSGVEDSPTPRILESKATLVVGIYFGPGV